MHSELQPREQIDVRMKTAGKTNAVMSADAPPSPTFYSQAAVRWRRRAPLMQSFLLLVAVPTALAAFYTYFVASPRYMSEFRVGVRAGDSMKAGGFADLFGFAGNSQTGNDANAVVQYLQSRQAIDEAQAILPVRAIFANERLDYFSRLDKDASIEEFTKYWNKMVEPFYETSTGTVVVKINAFSPVEARDLANALLKQSEALVNTLSERVRDDSVRFAQGEVNKAEARLMQVREKVRLMQDKEAILDPQKSVEQTLSLTAKLKEEIARRSADLATLRSRLSADAPAVLATRDQISGLQRELERVEAQVTAVQSASQQDRPLSSVIGSFQQLADEKLFAEKAYQSALVSLETSRMNAIKQQVYLPIIVRPGLPQDPVFPRPIRNTATAFFIALALWSILVMMVASVREHV